MQQVQQNELNIAERQSYNIIGLMNTSSAIRKDNLAYFFCFWCCTHWQSSRMVIIFNGHSSFLETLVLEKGSALGEGIVTKGFLKQPISVCSCPSHLEAELDAGYLLCEICHYKTPNHLNKILQQKAWFSNASVHMHPLAHWLTRSAAASSWWQKAELQMVNSPCSNYCNFW